MKLGDNQRDVVKDFYGQAAQKPNDNLCCPEAYSPEDTSHIPDEVIARFYGCGSPIATAELGPGEKVLDLGSGAGIDCFIAAKKVGPEGKVIGVDMTDEMLQVANMSKEAVTNNLGYSVVEFRKGFLEEIPVDDRSIDLVTSNCVINLSPDKRRVFKEISRVLKDNGRLVVSDIVSDREIPESIKANEQLLGECIAGALTENDFIACMEQTGFYGIEILKKTDWKTIEGTTFSSVTVRGYKFEKSQGCIYQGHKAIYTGPYKVAIDDEGHVFTRNQPVEVCTDTAAKLSGPPYSQNFRILTPDNLNGTESCCSPPTNGANGCC